MKAIIYILCYDECTKDIATEAFGAQPWARITMMPTTLYLENWMYSEFLDAHADEWADADYVGTLSWKAPTKVRLPDIDHVLSIADKHMPDAIAFFSLPTPLLEQTKETHFRTLWVDWLKALDYDEATSTDPDIPLFLCNYWLAKPAIMRGYIDFFKRARFVLDTNPELRERLWADSGYSVSIDPQRCQALYGRPYFPHHAFLCERLPPFYFYTQGLTVMHIRYYCFASTKAWQFVGLQKKEAVFEMVIPI